jgi:hypothetical protein
MARAIAAMPVSGVEPAHGRAEGEKIGSGRQPSKRKAKREALVAEPPALIQNFTMQDRDRGTTAAQSEIGARVNAFANSGKLTEGRVTLSAGSNTSSCRSSLAIHDGEHAENSRLRLPTKSAAHRPTRWRDC